MHNSDTGRPPRVPAVLADLSILRTTFRSGVRSIALACTSVTVFLAIGHIMAQ